MGLQLFRTHIISSTEVERKTVTSLIQLIQQERYWNHRVMYSIKILQLRRGETIDRLLVKNVIRMLVSLQVSTFSHSFSSLYHCIIKVYSEVFEHEFLEATRLFLGTEGANYIREMEVPDYLRHVEVRL